LELDGTYCEADEIFFENDDETSLEETPKDMRERASVVDRAFHGRSNMTCALCAKLTQQACFLKETQNVRSQLKWSSERIRNADEGNRGEEQSLHDPREPGLSCMISLRGRKGCADDKRTSRTAERAADF
jgi:hypothetical protein